MKNRYIKTGSIPYLLVIMGLLFSMQVNANDENFAEKKLDQTDANALTTANLLNTYWRLTELEGQPVITSEGQREMKLTLHTEDMKVNGFGGCNSFFGTYTHEGSKVKFGPLAATQKFCADSMERESRLFSLLDEVTNYTITGQVLDLNGDHGKPLLEFEAVYLK